MTERILGLFVRILTQSGTLVRVLGKRADLADLHVQIPEFEHFLTFFFREYDLPVERITLFKRIMGQEIYGTHSSRMLSVVVEDTLFVKWNLFKKLDDSGFADRDGYRLTIDETSARHFFRNLSTGMAQGIAYIFKQHAHNNHLLSRIVQEPASFIKDATKDLQHLLHASPELWLLLEEGYDDVSKVGDVTIQVRLKEIQFKRGSTVDVLPVDPAFSYLPVSFDSKVYKDGKKGIEEAFDQQMQLFVGDRFKTMEALLTSINALKPTVTDAQKAEFLATHVPAVFRHYIFVPADFDASIPELGSLYKTRMKDALPLFVETIEVKRGSTISTSDMELLMSALDAHIDDHFGSGTFINKNSEMLYAWTDELASGTASSE